MQQKKAVPAKKKPVPVTTTNELSTKLDALLVEFRHVVYGNGEIGVLERIRILENSETNPVAVRIAAATAETNRILSDHAAQPIHSERVFQVLSNIESWQAEEMTKKKMQEDADKDRRKRLKKYAIDVGKMALAAGVPSALAAASTIWAVLHR